MTDPQDIYEGIVARCAEIRGGKFIMSSANIAKLLRYIVSNSASCEYLVRCNEVIDYDAEREAASAQGGFSLPINKKKIVVLVTGLLREFQLYETKSKMGGGNCGDGTDIYSFLTEYFPADDIDSSFSRFCESVLAPYAKAFNDMLAEGEIKPEEIEAEERGWVEQISGTVREQLYPFIINLTEMVFSDNSLSSDVKQEYIDMLEGFSYVMETSTTRMVRVVWIGLKNTMAGYRDGQSHLRSIGKILESYAIL